MCEALRELMSDDIQMAEKNRQDQMIRKMLAKNMSAKTIAEIADVPVAYVKNFGKKAGAAT